MNKTEILNLVQEKISEKIRNLERLISETRESNNETKSSMGDKYETGREMLQQEINALFCQRKKCSVIQPGTRNGGKGIDHACLTDQRFYAFSRRIAVFIQIR